MSNKKRQAVLEAAVYQRVAPVIEALLFPPTLQDVVKGMGNSKTGVDVFIEGNDTLTIEAVAQDAEAAHRALAMGVREAKLLAERLSLPLDQDLPPAVVRHNEAGSEMLAVTKYRLAESAAWPGGVPAGWEAKFGPVVERIEGNDRGRIVFRGHSTRPYMLYAYVGEGTFPATLQAFDNIQEATAAFKPILDRVKAQASTSVTE